MWRRTGKTPTLFFDDDMLLAIFFCSSRSSDHLPAIKKRDPTRFSFLMPTDKYHQFYQYKLSLYKEMLVEAGLTPKNNVVTAVVGPVVPHKPAAAVASFSANGSGTNGATAVPTGQVPSVQAPLPVPVPVPGPTEQQTVTKKFPTLKGFFN